MEYRILDTFIWCNQKNRAPRPGTKYLLTVYGYHLNINFHHISYPKEVTYIWNFAKLCSIKVSVNYTKNNQVVTVVKYPR